MLSLWPSGKESAGNAGNTRDTSLIPGLGRSPGEGNGNPIQYSCLGNPMDRGPWLQSMALQSVRHDLATKQQFRVPEHTLFPQLPLKF